MLKPLPPVKRVYKGASLPTKKRLEKLILQEVSSFLRLKLFLDKLSPLVGITTVKLSPDLSGATIFWDTYDDGKKEAIEEILKAKVGVVRKHLARVIQTRKVPTIKFKYDTSFASEKAIEDILEREADLGKTY